MGKESARITNSSGAFLLVGKAADMTVTGAPKEWVGKGGTGGSTSRFFCGECGWYVGYDRGLGLTHSSVYDTGASEPGKVFVQAGKFGVHNRY